jgi:hypothetical protein
MFHEQYIPPQPSFTTRDLSEVVECLLEHNLVFSVEIDCSTHQPWEDINRTLHEHLITHSIELQLRPGDMGEQFTQLSWDVMAPSKSKQMQKINFKTGLAGPSSFTFKFISEHSLLVELEQQPTDKQFILIGLSCPPCPFKIAIIMALAPRQGPVTTRYGLLHYANLIRRTGPYLFSLSTYLI